MGKRLDSILDAIAEKGTNKQSDADRTRLFDYVAELTRMGVSVRTISWATGAAAVSVRAWTNNSDQGFEPADHDAKLLALVDAARKLRGLGKVESLLNEGGEHSIAIHLRQGHLREAGQLAEQMASRLATAK